jgi:UDP-N-acetylglucosamine:LPS N-acetylglucosamine transferase
MKNWKSTMSFFVFVGAYVFSLYTGKPDAVVATSGYIALYSSLFMMLRNDFTADIISKLINRINVNTTNV